MSSAFRPTRGIAKRCYPVLLSLALRIAVHTRNVPAQAFRGWARDHDYPVASADKDTHDDADLQPLRNIIDDPHLVAPPDALCLPTASAATR
jgi:hypothetical protein